MEAVALVAQLGPTEHRKGNSVLLTGSHTARGTKLCVYLDREAERKFVWCHSHSELPPFDFSLLKNLK